MNSRLNAICILAVLCFAGCASDATPNQAKKTVTQKQALENAISFQTTEEVIKDVHREIPGMVLRDAKPYIEKLGQRNLSCFLLTATPDHLADYEFQVDLNKLDVVLVRMSAGKSVVLYGDLTEITWKEKQGGVGGGSFRFDAENAFAGKCLFKAEHGPGGWKIVQLVIAHKRSNAQSKGYVVFDLHSQEK